MNEKFKLNFVDGDKTRTITESHPKLTATAEDFVAVGAALEPGIGLPLDNVTLTSETTIFQAS